MEAAPPRLPDREPEPEPDPDPEDPADPAGMSFAICRASRDLRRAALFGCRTPLAAARSRIRIASSAVARRSDSATGPPLRERRAFETLVFTSERTARLR